MKKTTLCQYCGLFVCLSMWLKCSVRKHFLGFDICFLSLSALHLRSTQFDSSQSTRVLRFLHGKLFSDISHFKCPSIRGLKALDKRHARENRGALKAERFRERLGPWGCRRWKTVLGILLSSASHFQDSGSNKLPLSERRGRHGWAEVPHSRSLHPDHVDASTQSKHNSFLLSSI